MKRFAVTPFLFCSLLALAVTACGDDGDDGDDMPDAREPGQPDAMEDPDPDAGPDLPPDAGTPPDAAPPPTPEIVVSATTLTVNENGATGATVTVKLSAAPDAAVTVAVASSNTAAATVDPASLSFDATNFGTEQTVTVTAPNDLNATNEMLTLTLSGAGLEDVTVAVTVIDDDALNIVANPTTVTVSEDGTAEFGVSLTVQPEADVTVSVASGDVSAATVAPATLTFTPANYDQAQTVTVTGVSDDDASDNAVNVNLTSTGLTPVAVAVTVDDIDIQTIQVNPASVAVDEDDTATFTVRLSHDPVDDFIVNIASSDEDAATASPATLTFTSGNFSQPQTVTVSGVSDPDADNETVTFTLSAGGADNVTVTATVTDLTPPLAEVYVRGTFNDFGLGNQMTYAGARRYTANVALNAATHEFKIADSTFADDTTFSVSAAGEVAIALNTPTPLVRAGGFDNNTLLTITQPGIYRFELLVGDVAAPVLTVSLAEAAPFNVNMFVGFTGPVAQNIALTYLGTRRYCAVISLPAPTFQNFKIADISLSPTTTFSKTATQPAQQMNLDENTTLVISTNPNAQTLLIITEANDYEFKVDATSTTNPVLRVSRAPAEPCAP
jgi:hypothetical protein